MPYGKDPGVVLDNVAIELVIHCSEARVKTVERPVEQVARRPIYVRTDYSVIGVRTTIMTAHDQLKWQLTFHASSIDIRTVRRNFGINAIRLGSDAHKSTARIKLPGRNRREGKSERWLICGAKPENRRDRIAGTESRGDQAWRILPHAIIFAERNPIVVEPDATAEHRHTVTIGVIREAEARTEVLV